MSTPDEPREDALPTYNATSATTTAHEMNGITETASPPSAANGLLEPSLKLDYSTIEKNLHKSDQAFAREVVKLIAERAENGIFARDCWGYKFLDPPVMIRPRLVSSQLLSHSTRSSFITLPKYSYLASLSQDGL